MKDYTNEDIVLHDPFTWNEIILKPGTEDHKKFLESEFNRRLLAYADETEAKYSDEYKSVAEAVKRGFSLENFNISRIVLTEKVKHPVSFNAEFNDIVYKAKQEFEDRQWFFNSRRTRSDFGLCQNAFMAFTKMKNITIITGK